MSRRKPFPSSTLKNTVFRAVEEALLKENRPYVLVVFYGNKICNVKIHLLERNQQFVPGTGLRGDENFDSVEAIIEHYKCFAVKLIDGKDKTGIHR
ncbi:hypothetical protein FD755_011292 [Muntiacus reevesi]|uniref:SH2 domain-containing protein n=1 Tax=Muntiacus reevesi TaxID=9886 RepID=A0A5N3XSB0_MUNRE|nr:hypothetical protein FD755_011292 [Muntiacus reevesi]